MFGHVVICTQNLTVSGANQVLLNLVEGEFCKLGEIVVISPSDGPFAQFFLRAGCAVRIGGVEVLKSFTTIRLAVCNTVMCAHLILELHQRGIPNMWILHEWWPREMLADELKKRNLSRAGPAVSQLRQLAAPDGWLIHTSGSYCGARIALFNDAWIAKFGF